MKIAIVGPGAMGCLYAFFLSRAGNEVWLLDNIPERAEKIKSQGLTLEGPGENQQIPFYRITTAPGIIGKAKLVIIFVKAYDTESAVRYAYPLIDSTTALLTLQNGLGNIEIIRSQCAEGNIIAGTTAHGATLLGDGHIRHAGIGETVIGGVDGCGLQLVKHIKELFIQAGIATVITQDVNGLVWGKLLINIGINPLTAIMKIRNGEIVNYPNLVNVMKRAVEEGAQVAQKMNIALPYANPIEKVIEVCNATAGNRSSMLQDIEVGKKTEIEYLNGAIVRYGESLGVPTPVNSLLTDLVQALEKC